MPKQNYEEQKQAKLENYLLKQKAKQYVKDLEDVFGGKEEELKGEDFGADRKFTPLS